MADNALGKFLIKRVIIIFVILQIVNLIFFDQRWLIAVGLICGTMFGILKFFYTSKFISSLLHTGNENFSHRRVVRKFILTQLATIVLIAASIKFDIWFFAGILTGILLVPVVIMINGITEALQITHNKFE